MTDPDITRDLTYSERATWGECPVCKASHGQLCDGRVGIPLGFNVHGELPADGAHMGRLVNAPLAVRLVPVR